MKKNDLPIYLFFAIVSFCKGLGLAGTNKIYIFAYLMGTVFVLTKMFFDKYQKKEINSLLVFIIIGIANFIIGDTTTVLFSAICLCGLKNVDINKVLKIMFWSKLLSFIILIGLSSVGIIENNFILHYREGLGMVKRYMFGFPHPNTTHISFFLIIILYVYLYRPKKIISTSIIITIINCLLYKYTLSRTSFIIIELYLMTNILTKYFVILKKIFMAVAKNSFIIFFIVTVLISLFYDKFSIIENIGTLLGRFNYNNYLLKNYQIPLIGNSIYNNYVIIDSSYISILYEGGLLISVYLIYLMQKLTRKLYEKKRINELMLIFFICMAAMIEGFYINAAMNFSLLFLSFIIFVEEKEDENET